MHKTVVICAVGLTPDLITSNTPRLQQFVRQGKLATIEPVTPAVTCSVQSTYLTGAWPDEHGVVGNGWYFRDECEVKFWRQSNRLVQRPKVWEIARQRDRSGEFTCANLFWWYAMYSSCDYTVTPRPMYPADGRKIPDVWTEPPELRYDLQQLLGQFPLFKFWGPATSVESTRWIADAATTLDEGRDPTLTLIYLPHLDYNLQRLGPDDRRCAQDLAELDAEIAKLLDHFERKDARIIILSEYGITPVKRPVHLNRVLRELQLLSIRIELGRELLDAGDSQAFAVADHQVAHVYVNDRAVLPLVERTLRATPGVAHVYAGDARRIVHLDHERAGELVVLAEPDAWFTYYYWLDDERAPDFARTVDIHRKPGYDPAELFIDPAIRLPKLKIAGKLLRRKLGMRTLLDVIGLDASLVRGSHGLPPPTTGQGPLLISNAPDLVDRTTLAPTEVCEVMLRHLDLD